MEKSPIDISVILATYKRPEVLEITLNGFCSLESDGLSWELIIVDNADDSRTREVVNGYSSVLPVQYMVEKKRGKNNALNTAIEHARGELFLFTDDDVIVDRRWLLEIREGTRRWPDHMVFGGRILPLYPKDSIDIPLDERSLNMAFVVADWGFDEGPYQAHKVWGPNMVVRRDIFRTGWRFNPNVGPSGSNYIMGSESEFNERLEKAGYVPIYLPGSLVHHIIREEQLTRKWLYKRAFRYGRFCAVKYANLQNGRLLFHVPIQTLKETLVAFAKFAVSILINDRKRYYRFGVRSYQMAGMVYQFRKGIEINRQE
ncbi:MAG: glycosyltransferase family 2 protein, partial [Thermodesulfobacteriota bacterium]